MINVLISLHRGYGLGDSTQMSAVLRHLAKHRPNWRVYYRNEHNVGHGIVHSAFAYGQEPTDVHFDAEVLVCLYDTWRNWEDRPNTRVSSCLHERFGLEWDLECAKYQVNVSRESLGKGIGFLSKIEKDHKVVAVHYQGDSSKDKKDLTHAQAGAVCDYIVDLGYTPLLIDWRDVSPLSQRRNVKTVGRIPESLIWGRDAEMNCAIIGQCEAFVGIDSGPSKCASATNTPSLVTWTGHHPAPFHDPAPNTTHLVPVGYHGLEPVCNDLGVIRWFEANHNVRQYESDLVEEIKSWLTEILR